MNRVVRSIKHLQPDDNTWPNARANIEVFVPTSKGYIAVHDIWFSPCSLDFLFSASKIRGLLALSEPVEIDNVGNFFQSQIHRSIGVRYELFVPEDSVGPQSRKGRILNIAFSATVTAIGPRRYFAPDTRGYNVLLERLHDDVSIPDFEKLPQSNQIIAHKLASSAK